MIWVGYGPVQKYMSSSFPKRVQSEDESSTLYKNCIFCRFGNAVHQSFPTCENRACARASPYPRATEVCNYPDDLVILDYWDRHMISPEFSTSNKNIWSYAL
ncbi:hypothetical protein Drorol1_Dr00009384 [Drosera rotundifolia]